MLVGVGWLGGVVTGWWACVGGVGCVLWVCVGGARFLCERGLACAGRVDKWKRGGGRGNLLVLVPSPSFFLF